MIEPDSNPVQADDAQWPSGFDGHRRAQTRRAAAWSFERKLAWLEEAARFARQFQEQRPASNTHEYSN